MQIKIQPKSVLQLCTMRNCKKLIHELNQDLDYQTQLLNELKALEPASLNQRANKDSWSALECVAHLNSFAKHYNASLKRAIKKSKTKGHQPETEFQGTWIGQYHVQNVLPEHRPRKLKSPGHHNFLASKLNLEELNQLSQHLEEQKTILMEANQINLNRTKVSLESMPWLKLRVGDFLPFLIKHQSRHLVQALEVAALTDEVTFEFTPANLALQN